MEPGEADGDPDYELLDFDMDDVWVLGRDDINAGECIRWDAKELPNLLDCECLIVDLTTLDKETLSNIPHHMREKMRKDIQDRFRHDLMIICILSTSGDYNPSQDMLFWCPVRFSARSVPPATKILSDDFGLYYQYMTKVDQWNMVLKPEDSVGVSECATSTNNDLIGAVFTNKHHDISGDLVILPPLGDADASIHSVLEFFNARKPDDLHAWVKKVKIPRAVDLQNDLTTLNKEYVKRKDELESEIRQLDKWLKLLYATGNELAAVVRDALELIGLENARLGIEKKADISFDLNIDKYESAMVEVKGVSKKIKLKDLSQARYWAGDKHKPVMVANIFRNKEYPKSRDERMNFTEYQDGCERFSICIIPSVLLFDLVCDKLAGKKMDAGDLIKSIATCSGVLKIERPQTAGKDRKAPQAATA